MKKKFLDNKSLPFMRNALFNTEDGGGGAAESPELKAIKDIGDQVNEFKNLLGDKANETEIADLKKELAELKDGIETLTGKQVMDLMESINKKNDSLHKQLIELQEEADKNKEAPSTRKGRRSEFISTKSVEDFVKASFEDGKKTRSHAEIELKAAEDFGYPTFFEGGEDTDITAFTGRFIDPTLYKVRHKRNMILDWFDIQTINVPTLLYLQKEEIGDSASVSGDPGGAEWILAGDLKPKRSFRVSTGKAEAKKVAIFGTVQDDLLQDVPSFENWLREDFYEQMREQINNGLLNNNPDTNPDAPLGLKVNAIQYSATPAFADSVEDPTYIDDLIAVFALFANNREEAGMAFVSADVYYRIQGLKDLNLRYQNSPLVYTNKMGELYIAGVHVVWVDQEDVPSTHVLVIGKDLGFKIKAYGNMVFERGLNDDDFRRDRTSFRGYQKFLSYIPSNRENSVLYDTWANIEAGIAAPVS